MQQVWVWLSLHEFRPARASIQILFQSSIPNPILPKCSHMQTTQLTVFLATLGWPGTYFLGQPCLEPMLILLPWPPLCWNCRLEPPFPYIFFPLHLFACLFILECVCIYSGVGSKEQFVGVGFFLLSCWYLELYSLSRFPETEVEAVARHHVGDGNRTCIIFTAEPSLQSSSP